MGRRRKEIAVFDFLSGDHMHLAFNEGYLRTVRAAYPDDLISYQAIEGNVKQLARRLTDLADIELKPCRPFQTSFGLSHHNPVVGRWAARECRNTIYRELTDRHIRFVVLLGFNASLLAVIGHGWPTVSAAPLHLILHGQLGEAMAWRSRNPLIRAADLVSQLQRPLPRSVRIVALELGVEHAIIEIAPAMAPSIVTLEHPILVSEWAKDQPLPRAGKIKIAFVGHTRADKGFDTFVAIANDCSGHEIEFHAIGHSSQPASGFATDNLARKPAEAPVPREQYLAALAEMDIICLPWSSNVYNFTASGTLSDAVACLKPLIVFRNRTSEAISARYGQLGWLVKDRESAAGLIQTLGRSEFAKQVPVLIDTLKNIRRARMPQTLAASYAAFDQRDDRDRRAAP